MQLIFDTTFRPVVGQLLRRTEDAGCVHEATARWRPAHVPERLPDALHSTIQDGQWRSSIVEVPGGFGLLELRGEEVWARVACREATAVTEALDRLRALVPAASAPPSTDFPVRFWWRDNDGGARCRSVSVPGHRWPEIADGYSAATRTALGRLMDAAPTTAEGRLVLWCGAPGTGKTHALRALAIAWCDTCTVEAVIDAEQALAGGPGYLLEVLEASAEQDRTKLLVIEDGGHLLERSDKGRAGLGRLLNLVDGLLGEAHDPRVLITTNLGVIDLDPAAVRPGRCAAVIAFESLSAAEGNAWLSARGSSARIAAPTTLADLHALLAGREPSAPPRHDVGFVRRASTGASGTSSSVAAVTTHRPCTER